MPPRRALGPRDKRLQSHRCKNCRRARTKCDGARPCSTCRVRRVQCTEAVVSSQRQQPTFLHYLPELTAPHPSLDETASLEAFFAFVGPEPHSPITLQFTPTALRPYLCRSGPVKAVAAAIGALVSTKRQNPAANHFHTFANTRRSLHSVLHIDVDDPFSHLLFSLLLAIFEFLYESSGLGFFTVMNTASTRIIAKCVANSCPENNWLLVLYNYLDTGRALYTREEPASCPMTPPPPETSSAEQLVFYHIVKFLCLFSSLHSRVPRWLSQVVNFAEACPHCGQDPAGGSTLHCHPCGEQLVQQGHVALEELQSLAIAVGENAQATTDPKYWSSIAPAWYHACAISMASLYADEAWSSFDPDAVRPLVDSANTGLPWPTRLDAIEKRIAVVDFEVFSLLPMLLSLSLEVNDFGVRERIVALYNSIIAKGYAAGTFLRDGLTYLQSISSAQSQLSLVGSSGSL
ncbi:putative transcriptional regulatory protein [Lasiodiplodia hormozganensis]|uniref:Transcriptional regulatory protein n=1 Tax=Lasiodiplodia hormozganensis TaxID=869390 RepID=A0AA39Z1C0_9PEZI|nr:putative transcriptional regulatory protein [Lasiodiplodia hormozganensis]